MEASREDAARAKVYGDIQNYARSKMAGELRQKYCPDEDEAPVQAAAPAEQDQLDEESLQRLAAMAGE